MDFRRYTLNLNSNTKAIVFICLDNLENRPKCKMVLCRTVDRIKPLLFFNSISSGYY